MKKCPSCGSLDLDLVRKLRPPAMILRCLSCDHVWQFGEEPAPPQPGQTKDQRLRAKFPTTDHITGPVWTLLRTAADRYELSPKTAEHLEFRRRFHELFARDRIGSLTVDQFTEFYMEPAYAHVGPAQMVIHDYVRRYGAAEYAEKAKEAIEYLLYSEKGSLEQRFTDLVAGQRSPALPGLKETILTKVLVAWDPGRFFPLLAYDSKDGSGKRQIAAAVLGLELPSKDKSDWTIGRLAIWSNDLFVDIARRLEIKELQEAGEIIWLLWTRARDGEPLLPVQG